MCRITLALVAGFSWIGQGLDVQTPSLKSLGSKVAEDQSSLNRRHDFVTELKQSSEQTHAGRKIAASRAFAMLLLAWNAASCSPSCLRAARPPLHSKFKLSCLTPVRAGQCICCVSEASQHHSSDRHQVPHAVVLGASIAGLLSARVLSELGWRVTLLEKDELPAVPPSAGEVRKAEEVRLRLRGRDGTPQARHIHTLLPQGAAALESLFPGIKEEFVRAGGRRVAFESCIKINIGGFSLGDAMGGNSFPNTILVSRCLIEETIRRRVSELEGVTLQSGAIVKELIGSGGHVRGVSLKGGEQIMSSLVVDASGRRSRCERWIAQIGGDVPKKEIVDCKVVYADALMRPAPEDSKGRGWSILKVDHGVGQGRRGGIIYEIEHGLWLVGLSGCLGERAPQTKEDWLKYAKGLPDPELSRFIERAEFLSPVYRLGATGNIRRYWESTSQAAGFVAVGDALCAPNPLYGQGMTMASMQALALRSSLRESRPQKNGEPLPAPVTTAAQAACAAAIESAWELASGTDGFRMQVEKNVLLMPALKIFWLLAALARGAWTASDSILSMLLVGGREAVQMVESLKASVAAAAESQEASEAVVGCACGKTKLTLSTRRPRMRLECCCTDCRQALEWAASRGGPTAPLVPQWHYFENDILKVEGEENLKLCRLRRGALVTRGVATCCYSTMFADHPIYQENVFAVPSDVCQLCAKSIPMQARIFTKDRDGDTEMLLPYLGKGPCVRGDEDWPLQLIFPLIQPARLPRKGISLQQLCARLDPPVALGFPPWKRFYPENKVNGDRA